MQKLTFLALFATALVVCSLLQGADGHGKHSSKERGKNDRSKKGPPSKGVWGSDSKESVNLADNEVEEFFQRDSRCNKANSEKRGKSKCHAEEKRKVAVLKWSENGKTCTCFGHKWKRCAFEAPANATTVSMPESTTEGVHASMALETTTETYDEEEYSSTDGASTTAQAEETATSIGIFRAALY